MRILLIGCTGFIGKSLIPKLISEGHELYIVSRKDITQLKLNISFDKISFIKLNLAKENNWENKNFINQLKSSEAVINLSGEPIADKRWSEAQKQEIENSRINTTAYLMENLKKFNINPKVVINASAIGFYGSSLDEEFNEISPAGNDFLAKLCKRWEAKASQKPFFTRLVIFRIGIVLGINGGALSKMLPIFKVGLGGPIGDGNQWMSWIHIDDLCELILNALKDKKFSGVFNAVAPKPVRMREFALTLAKCLNRPNLFPVPGATLKLLLGDGAKLVLEGQKVISIKLRNNFYKFKYPQIQEAISSLTKK
tara:strand:- start:18132 stop:19064 length:933 start_codon:yes stop_codon:yes gene_type:complete